MNQKPKGRPIEIEVEQVHGTALTDAEIMAMCAIEKKKIHERAERMGADNPMVPHEIIVQIVMDRHFKQYKFN